MADVIERHFLKRARGPEFDMEVEWLRRHLPAEGDVADIGCGIGGLFDIVGSHRAIGVDYQPDGLAHTQSRFPAVPLVCADAQHLPFADSAFDAVASQHVIEHLPEFHESCRDWFRVLKPGGVLLLLTPNAAFRDPSVFDDDTHVFIFDRQSLSDVMRDSGFEIVDMRTLGLPWFRQYHDLPGGWRLRRFVTNRANELSSLPPLRFRGQTLCCVARRPEAS